MKQFILFLTVATVVSSCRKTTNIYGVDCSANMTKAIQSETDSIARYLEIRNANGANIQAVLHPNGFYYVIENEGEGVDRPQTCSAVSVDYKGRRFGGPSIEGTVFDQAQDATFSLYQTISGWQQGLPLIGKGGKISLYIPPSLAYGATGTSTIKPNTYLQFEITLNSFN